VERSLELDVPQVQSGNADQQLAGRLRRDGSEQFALAETAAPRHASGSTVPPSANAWQVQQLCSGWLERHPELPAAAREVTQELGWRGQVHAELAELDRPRLGQEARRTASKPARSAGRCRLSDL